MLLLSIVINWETHQKRTKFNSFIFMERKDWNNVVRRIFQLCDAIGTQTKVILCHRACRYQSFSLNLSDYTIVTFWNSGANS
jgi:hypothetical protein